jgi:hypothetical protein
VTAREKKEIGMVKLDGLDGCRCRCGRAAMSGSRAEVGSHRYLHGVRRPGGTSRDRTLTFGGGWSSPVRVAFPTAQGAVKGSLKRVELGANRVNTVLIGSIIIRANRRWWNRYSRYLNSRVGSSLVKPAFGVTGTAAGDVAPEAAPSTHSSSTISLTALIMRPDVRRSAI